MDRGDRGRRQHLGLYAAARSTSRVPGSGDNQNSCEGSPKQESRRPELKVGLPVTAPETTSNLYWQKRTLRTQITSGPDWTKDCKLEISSCTVSPGAWGGTARSSPHRRGLSEAIPPLCTGGTLPLQPRMRGRRSGALRAYSRRSTGRLRRQTKRDRVSLNCARILLSPAPPVPRTLASRTTRVGENLGKGEAQVGPPAAGRELALGDGEAGATQVGPGAFSRAQPRLPHGTQRACAPPQHPAPPHTPARSARESRPTALGAYLLLGKQHPPLPLFLLLPGLSLVTPHAGHIVLVPDVPTLLGQDIHGVSAVRRLAGPPPSTSYWRDDDPPCGSCCSHGLVLG